MSTLKKINNKSLKKKSINLLLIIYWISMISNLKLRNLLTNIKFNSKTLSSVKFKKWYLNQSKLKLFQLRLNKKLFWINKLSLEFNRWMKLNQINKTLRKTFNHWQLMNRNTLMKYLKRCWWSINLNQKNNSSEDHLFQQTKKKYFSIIR